MSASLLFTGDRRMEAEAFLKEGFLIRRAMEAKQFGWSRIGDLAVAVAPPRIKQVLVSPEHGTPYLNTSQVFDPIPTPRKWLAVGKTSAVEQRFVAQGDILVMASATVGRAIIATAQHENAIISHHFLRLSARDPVNWGWLYAYIQSPQCQEMIGSSQYASVIRHIEAAHLHALPIPVVTEQIATHFSGLAKSVVALRNESTRLTRAAESAFEAAITGGEKLSTSVVRTVSIKQLNRGRRRLEGSYHTEQLASLLARFKMWQPLEEVVDRVWWPNRFKRVFREDGTPYLGPDDLFTTNLYQPKKVVVEGKKDIDNFAIKPNWIAMARSGQTYGLNGSAKLLTEYHQGWFLSDDLIRIATNPNKASAGYILTALTHPRLGRPLVIREAYGTSIPHLDPADVAAIPIVRLGSKVEQHIGDLAETAALKLAEAEHLEREIARQAGQLVEQFLTDSEISSSWSPPHT